MNDKLENLLREFEVTTCDNEAFWKELLNLFSVSCRYLAVFVDGEYKQMVTVMAKDEEEAESKLKTAGWINYVRLVKIEDDVQVVYNGN